MELQDYKKKLREMGCIDDSFDEPVLYNPARVEDGQTYTCSNLKIITAYTDIDRISTHMIGLADGMKEKRFAKDVSVEIIIGMAKSSISKKKHDAIVRLVKYINSNSDMPKLSCRYICQGKEVHSKVYLWSTYTKTKGSTIPMLAYAGSLNYTMNAFYKRRESVVVADAFAMDLYYKNLLKDTLDCTDLEVMRRIKNLSDPSAKCDMNPDEDLQEKDYEYYNSQTPVDILKVSLLTADGSQTGYGSGINWGIRKNGTKRNRNQAYIPYNVADRKEGFFPDRIHETDLNCPIFKVITKDIGSFHMRMAQQNNKALHSAESNAILGEWIRNRMGIMNGTLITKEMLEHYGKTYVTFRKYKDGTYLLDF